MSHRPTLFFISGAQKSGTTWLAATLHSHPQVKAVGEAWLFGGGACDLDTWLNREKVREWAARPMGRNTWRNGLTPEQLERLLLRGLGEAIMLRGAPHHKAVGDKTPLGYLRRPEALFDVFPDSRFINIVRDGRDVAVSQAFLALRDNDVTWWNSADQLRRAADFHLYGRGEPCPLFAPGAIGIPAGLWRESIEGARRARALWKDQFIEFRYEALLADPMSVRAAFVLLGVDADEATVRRCVDANSFEARTGRRPGDADPTSAIRKGIAGDWKNYFTEADKALYKQVCAPLLIDLGYAADNDW
jgi:hypothetical protein